MRSTGGSPSGHQQPCQRNEIRSSPLMSGRSPRSVRTGSAMSHRNAPLSPEGRRRLIQRCQDRPIAACCRRDGHLTVVRVKVGQPIPRIRRTRPPRSILHPASSADSDPRRNQSPTSSICVVHRNGQPRALRSNSTTKAPTSADVPSPATRDSWDYTAADSSTERRQQPPAAQANRPMPRTPGPPRRQEGRTHPPRRRMAHPRARQRSRPAPSLEARPRANAVDMCTYTLPATDTPGLLTPKRFRTRRQPPRSDSSIAPEWGRRSWHRPNRADSHRQGGLSPSRCIRPSHARSPPPTNQTVHPTP